MPFEQLEDNEFGIGPQAFQSSKIWKKSCMNQDNENQEGTGTVTRSRPSGNIGSRYRYEAEIENIDSIVKSSQSYLEVIIQDLSNPASAI